MALDDVSQFAISEPMWVNITSKRKKASALRANAFLLCDLVLPSAASLSRDRAACSSKTEPHMMMDACGPPPPTFSMFSNIFTLHQPHDVEPESPNHIADPPLQCAFALKRRHDLDKSGSMKPLAFQQILRDASKPCSSYIRGAIRAWSAIKLTQPKRSK